MMRRGATFTRTNVALAATAGLLASMTAAAVAVPADAGQVQTVAAPGGVETIAVSRIENGARVFYIASALVDGGGTVTRVVFGNADDVPTLAQNDEGQCEPAVYRNSNATFYQASASVDGGGTVAATQFGNAGDLPIQNTTRYHALGDHKVALRRPSNATFYTLVLSPDSPSDVQMDPFGNPSDVGFFGLGNTDVYTGVYRPGNSTFYFQYPTEAKPTTVQQFGSPGDQGLIGAFVAAGDTSQQNYVGVFRPSSGRWFLSQQPVANTGTTLPPITDVKSFAFGSPGDAALACVIGQYDQ